MTLIKIITINTIGITIKKKCVCITDNCATKTYMNTLNQNGLLKADQLAVAASWIEF